MNLIYAGMKARLSDGITMPVRGAVLDPMTHRRTHLVLGANGLFGPDVIVPASAIWLIDQDVHLSISCADVLTMPVFHRFRSSADTEHPVEPIGDYISRRRAPHRTIIGADR